jgi:hypothetical protein
MLGAAPRVGPFSLLVARPYSFLDAGLDVQAKPLSIYIIKMTLMITNVTMPQLKKK